ncbi:hypothetical protein [Bacillus sp. EB600]|uniref:hypothetical protein n=1 Tax=Bacillus sp. EB600 TaxID=2806345 RepID=UPI00210A55E1|nr:hypothetical protein [Bacillus sp. EB600]MCQ6282614.1 hypothetical protein [Bacillus sp. EB600]
MKFSTQSLEDLLGAKTIARHRKKPNYYLEEQFENPIIHQQVYGNKVYVPLNIDRTWNQVS